MCGVEHRRHTRTCCQTSGAVGRQHMYLRHENDVSALVSPGRSHAFFYYLFRGRLDPLCTQPGAAAPDKAGHDGEALGSWTGMGRPVGETDMPSSVLRSGLSEERAEVCDWIAALPPREPCARGQGVLATRPAVVGDYPILQSTYCIACILSTYGYGDCTEGRVWRSKDGPREAIWVARYTQSQATGHARHLVNVRNNCEATRHGRHSVRFFPEVN